jgi:hypothetical protein
MGVLNDVDPRGFAGQRGGIDQCGQPPPTGIRVDLGQRHLGIGGAQQILKEHQVLWLRARKLRPDPRAGGLRVKTLDAGDRTQQPRHGLERDLAGVRLAKGGEHLHTAGGGHRSDFAHQAALTNTWQADHAHHRAVPASGTVQQALDNDISHCRPTSVDSARPTGPRSSDMLSNRCDVTGSSAPLI